MSEWCLVVSHVFRSCLLGGRWDRGLLAAVVVWTSFVDCPSAEEHLSKSTAASDLDRDG